MSDFNPTHRHFKGGLYQFLYSARHSETEQAMVVYRDHQGGIWVRPAAMWDEIITPPDGRPPQPRFAPIVV
jgi:hypothetical protein